MKPMQIFEWITGSMSDFTKPFQNNQALFNQARSFWRQLDSSMVVVLIILVVLSIAMAVAYYKPYNEKPGRHFKPLHWLLFGLGAFVITLVTIWLFLYIAVKPVLAGAVILELKVAVGSAVYAAVIYLITSVVWCNFLPTNAYRIFKF